MFAYLKKTFIGKCHNTSKYNMDYSYNVIIINIINNIDNNNIYYLYNIYYY